MTTRYLKRLLTTAALGLLMAVPSYAAISEQDAGYIASCRLEILDSQLPGGVIPKVAYRDAKVDIDPYFSNLACLGLLSAHNFKPDASNNAASQNLQCVLAWLKWYADNQDASGTIGNFRGRMQGDIFVRDDATILPDSHDSYAATYLSLVEAYLRAGGTLAGNDLTKVKGASLLCFDVLKQCKDANGFYNNFIPARAPGGTYGQYLLDNTEVHQGLVAASRLFARWSDNANATSAGDMATALAGQMHLFWYPDQKYFVTLYGDKPSVLWGTRPTSANEIEYQLGTKGLTTVSALGFFEGIPGKVSTDLWKKLFDTYGDDLEADFIDPDFGKEEVAIERAYFAALNAGSAEDRSHLLGLLRNRAAAVIAAGHHYTWPYYPHIPYVHRYGMIIQGLLAQDGQLPQELPRVPLRSFLGFPNVPTIVTPEEDSLRTALTAVSGTAVQSDGRLLSKVAVGLRRADGKYWSGNSWGSYTLMELPLTGSSWRLVFLPSRESLGSGRHTIIAYVDDISLNRSGAAVRNFNIDHAGPNPVVVKPAEGENLK